MSSEVVSVYISIVYTYIQINIKSCNEIEGSEEKRCGFGNRYSEYSIYTPARRCHRI